MKKFKLFEILFQLYFIVSYIVNAIQFFSCDFEPSYRDEIIKGVGLIGLSFITVWF